MNCLLSDLMNLDILLTTEYTVSKFLIISDIIGMLLVFDMTLSHRLYITPIWSVYPWYSINTDSSWSVSCCLAAHAGHVSE